ncbi:hypothetical protein ElyMa_001067100 [Elysia marginata]|uniref:Uncharacterized protein n=1 Tax=Elysia marginata TaxID=1093978 RepID=A0AAV4HRB6_9GAST|nr:hypothetical protein ElyMa_001067100 [Elysia marginata]
MPQQNSTFEVCSWVPIFQVDGLGKVRVHCFPKAITIWHGWESNPRPPDLEPDALTTPPRCPYQVHPVSGTGLGKKSVVVIDFKHNGTAQEDGAHSGGNPRWRMG